MSQSIGEKLFGKESERIPNIVFHIMSAIMTIMDRFGHHADRTFRQLGVKKGQTVVDYGCGPARYIRHVSLAVGEKGRVYAVDIHPIAVEKVNKKVRQLGLDNVTAVQAAGYDSGIPDHTADLVFALDMFHMIKKSAPFLRELHRICKPSGQVIIEDGHQSRKETLEKITKSGYWRVLSQNKTHVRCVPQTG